MYQVVFKPAEYAFEDYFGAPRHVDAQETISSQIIVCNAVLTVPGGFFLSKVELVDIAPPF